MPCSTAGSSGWGPASHGGRSTPLSPRSRLTACDRARSAKASALLAGEPPDGLAARLGRPVAPAYAVVALRLAAHPDEADNGVGGAVAARRKIRRVQGALDAFAGVPVLGLLEPAGGV